MRRKFTVQPSRTVCASSRKNYGGAFDIDPEMFFTRDDLDELNEAVLGHISETFSGDYQISDSWIGGDDNQQVHVEVDDVDAGVTHSADVHVDMRKIHKPSDLRDKYALQLAAQIIEAIKEYQNIYSNTEAVTPNSASTRWIGKYTTIHNKVKKVYFDCNSRDYDEVEKLFEDSIPEPFVKFNLLGTCNSSDSSLNGEGFQYMNIYSSEDITGSNMLPGPGDFDPPEYDEPEDVGEIVEYVETYLDADIVVDEDGDYDYVDSSCPWADPSPSNRSGEWTSDEYPDLRICYSEDVVEKVDEMISSKIPSQPGRYHITGDVTLYYSITGVQMYREFDFIDEDGHPSYNTTYDTDSADPFYVAEESSVDNFQCVPM